MARVTVEDCVLKIPNRFELVLLSAERSRELAAGALPTVARDNDKTPVIALREIADDTISADTLRYRFSQTLRHNACGFSQGETYDQELKQAINSEGTSCLNDEDDDFEVTVEQKTGVSSEEEDFCDDDLLADDGREDEGEI